MALEFDWRPLVRATAAINDIVENSFEASLVGKQSELPPSAH